MPPCVRHSSNVLRTPSIPVESCIVSVERHHACNHSPTRGISNDVEAVISLRPDCRPAPVRSLTDPTEARVPDLVERAVAGEVEAFEELYRRTVGRVFGLCLRMCGNRSLAEDLTQESFVRAWQKLPSFRGESAFSTWMHRLTVNVVLGHQRSAGRRQTRETAAGEEWYGDGSAGPGRPAAAMDLERAVAGLPKGARTVFVLHDVEGYKHAEIAQLTGVAVGTSKAQLSRARQLLRKALTS